MDRQIKELNAINALLHENIAILENILEKAADGICVCHNIPDEPYVRFTHWNPRMTQMTGYTLEEINQLGWYQTLYTDPEVQKRAVDRMSRMRTENDIHAEEWVITAKDGEKRPLSISTSIIKEEDGRIHVLGIMQDISQRKKAEEALRKNEEKYRELFEKGSDLLCIHDLEGNLIQTNVSFKKAYGYNSDDLAKANLRDFVPERYRHQFADYLKRIIEKGKDEGFMRVLTKDGREIIIEYNNVLICDGTGPMWVQGSARDITERLKNERALKQSEEKYRNILENIEDGYYEVDLAGNFTFFNNSLCRMLGYSCSEMMGMNNREYSDQENAGKVFQTFNRIFTTGEPTKAFDWEFNKKDGTKCYVDTSVSLIRNDNGKAAGFRGIVRDVTERKKAERELAESEERFRQLHEAAFSGIAIHDKGVILECNRGLSELTGFAYDELIGMDGMQLVAPERREEVMKNILSGYEKPYEAVGIRKDGSRCSLEIRGKKIPYQGRKVRVTEFRDTTERKAAEEALIRSQEQYRGVVENANDAIIILQDGFVVFNNQRAETLIGYSKEELSEIPFISFIHPDDRDAVFDQYLKKLNRDKVVTPYTFRVMDKNGNEIWGDISTVLISWQGKPAVQCFIRDVTLQKKLETQLRQAHKLEAIGTLAGGIAHDFNNILSIILGNTELAMLDIQDWSPARKNLEESRTACFRARDVVRQILSFSRQTEQEQKPIDLGSIIRESLKLLRASIPTTIDIKLNIPEGSYAILADPAQIHQVIINLCANAGHAMKEKGGVIEVSLMETTLDEHSVPQSSGLSPGRYMRLSVSDSGHGIDPKILDRIFDPYFTTKKVGEGSGMGLAVVHGIVKNHGGAITVFSEPGKGTIFQILFPKIDAELAPEKKISEELPKGNEKILYVDDEISLAKIGKKMLEHLGYRVESKNSPIDALEMFKAAPYEFDLVITDMTMPQMTGKVLAQELIRIRPDIPILLNTGYSDQIDESTAKEAGIGAYIMKPLDTMQLATTIRSLLDKK